MKSVEKLELGQDTISHLFYKDFIFVLKLLLSIIKILLEMFLEYPQFNTICLVNATFFEIKTNDFLIHQFKHDCVLGAQKNRLIKTVVLNTHNIYFGCQRRIFFQIQTVIWRPGYLPLITEVLVFVH